MNGDGAASTSGQVREKGEGRDQGGPSKKKARKEKKVKDPLAPKKPASAYFMFIRVFLKRHFEKKSKTQPSTQLGCT